MMSVEGVKQAAVVHRNFLEGSRAKAVIAFISLKEGYVYQEVLTSVKSEISDKLSPWMMPHHFEMVGGLPFNPHGKIDYPALHVSELRSTKKIGEEGGLSTMEAVIISIWKDVLGLDSIKHNDDFFSLGGDSQHVIRVVGRCVLEGLPLAPALLYLHPTPEGLSAAILDGGMEGGQRAVHDDGISSESLVPDTLCGEALESAISAKLREEKSAGSGETKKKVLLTGATGFFGCRLLCELLSTNEEIGTVVCLVRCKSPSHGLERIIQALEFQKMDLPSEFRERVEIAVGDVGLERFGMSAEDYAEISRSTCEVYHSAALVNTVLPYSKLHPVNVGGVRKILEFCLHGAPKKLHYMSTLSVFVGSDRNCKIAKEDDDLSEPCKIYGGYAQSKWTAERFLLNARKCGMEVVVYRLGLITGDTRNGVMKETDILSAVLQSLTKTGRIPEEQIGSEPMAFDVTPVDFAANTVALLASKHQRGDPGVFHVSGKRPVTLSLLASLLSECGVQIERVAKGVWEEQVTNQDADALAFVGLSRALDHKNWTSMRTLDIFQATGIIFDQENTETLLKESLQYPGVHAPLLHVYIRQNFRLTAKV